MLPVTPLTAWSELAKRGVLCWCVLCVQLSKEVRRLRGYERGMVTGYQHYLNALEETLHLGFPLSRQGTPPNKVKKKKGQCGVDALLGGRKLTEASMRVSLLEGHRAVVNRPWAVVKGLGPLTGIC